MKSIRSILTALTLASVLALTTTSISAAEKDMLSSKQVKALVANAKTAADHTKLARHYAAMADKHEAEAVEHEALAVEYAKRPSNPKMPMAGNTAEHCKFFAEHCRRAAKEMRDMAAAHEAMAKEAK
ncbi:MAG: hypothetical protein IT168_26295 [Bryobacterales bacterium]|nr:hypothetical protein [Bryobacterales bacterium]